MRNGACGGALGEQPNERIARGIFSAAGGPLSQAMQALRLRSALKRAGRNDPECDGKVSHVAFHGRLLSGIG